MGSLDPGCKYGYWQVQIEERDKEKIAFAHHGLYKFTRVPFGLKNVRAIFQRRLDLIIASVKC